MVFLCQEFSTFTSQITPMVFIPREAQDKMQNLEKEVKKLAQENQVLKDEALQSSTSKKGNWGYIFVILFLLSGAYLFYSTIYNPTTVITTTVNNGPDSLTVYLDGNIKKLYKGAQGNLIYRVQIGAFAEFSLEQYNINLDAIEQITVNGINRISLGSFSRLVDAQTFQQHMVKMGLEQCYIVAYKNEVELGTLPTSGESQNSTEQE